jgi:hypothetical protein
MQHTPYKCKSQQARCLTRSQTSALAALSLQQCVSCSCNAHRSSFQLLLEAPLVACAVTIYRCVLNAYMCYNAYRLHYLNFALQMDLTVAAAAATGADAMAISLGNKVSIFFKIAACRRLGRRLMCAICMTVLLLYRFIGLTLRARGV